MRACFKAATWYYEHLGGQKPFIIVTQNEDLVRMYQHKRVEVFVMTLGDYLKKFWPDLTSAHDVYESLLAVHSEKMLEGDTKQRREQAIIFLSIDNYLTVYVFKRTRFISRTDR
jgi:DIS3-like exonuclease 1